MNCREAAGNSAGAGSPLTATQAAEASVRSRPGPVLKKRLPNTVRVELTVPRLPMGTRQARGTFRVTDS